jgi:hypothetical protein
MQSRVKAAKERHKLEGALGYALRIVDAIHDGKVKSTEELTDLIDEDMQRINGALADHNLEDLKMAGSNNGLFEDKKPNQPQN